MAQKVIERWLTRKFEDPEESQITHDLQMLKLSKLYKNLYSSNVYKLNSCALKI